MGRPSNVVLKHRKLAKQGAAARQREACKEAQKSDSIDFDFEENGSSCNVEMDSENPESCFITPTIRPETDLLGRRLISVKSLLRAMNHVSIHAKSCPNFSLTYERESLIGLQTDLYFRCNCGFSTTVSSDFGEESLSSNRALSMGCQIAPVGFSAASTLLTVLDVPNPSSDLFGKCQEKTFADLQIAADEVMKKAGEEEKRLAEEAGDFIEISEKDENGNTVIKVYPWTTVIVDGSWPKRSYGHTYDSNSGTAVVIGVRTGKVLACKVRNKTCIICTRAKNKNEEPKPHECYKNWDGKSTAMEPDILLECFNESRNVHGLVYKRFIGDGDSAVHSAIMNVYPGNEVEKLECCNHALKNFHRKLVNISSNNVTGCAIPADERKIPGQKERFERIGAGIVSAINHHAENRHDDSWKELHEDIMNSMLHVYGHHNCCKTYYCPVDSERRKEIDLLPQVQTKVFWNELVKAVAKLASLSKSLIERQTTNPAEAFMSTCNRYNEGKRKYLSHRFLYNLRILSAVLSFNTQSFWGVEAYRAVHKQEPLPLWGKLRLRAVSVKSRIIKKKSRSWPKLTFLKPRQGDSFYGANPSKPDMNEAELKLGIAYLREKLKPADSVAQRALEEATRKQSDCSKWFEERRCRVTASVCGEICRRKPTTNNRCILNKILGKTRSTEAMRYGKDHESQALSAYAQNQGISLDRISNAGLVVSLEDGIFAASPDAYVDNDGIVEIKCPSSCRNTTAENWGPIKSRNSTIPRLKRNHVYYYQVVMQLYVTGRKWCDFVVWTPYFLHVERIEWNSETAQFWSEMVTPLTDFWVNELAPEIVDSRADRQMEYRCPVERMVTSKKSADKGDDEADV